ncbi:post-transcriptional regulator [Marinicrinis sediminis]|uniref:Post-transcriptional regulator n=1 Tax=Marinicrinis sediminis TaxID=1652465 RepID=A0ABW5R5Y2_9BACL
MSDGWRGKDWTGEDQASPLRLVVDQGSSANQAERDGELSESELNHWIEQLCLSKAEEFHLLGYAHVEGKEVWECVSEKYEKEGYPALHKMVNDIMSLKVTQFMNWMTMSVYRSSGPFKQS